jgi:Pyridoxamine 5'-phosphate oxidase
MDESPAEIEALQILLDRSYTDAGPHLRDVITPERRVSAQSLASRLQGVRLLTLATVTRDGRPLTGPVDGIFYRGAFHFSSSRDSVRMRHIAHRPQVSATHLPGEDFAVTVHGQATRLDLREPANEGFRRAVLGVYTPTYGPDWETFLDEVAVYARIDASRMFTFQLATPES